MKLKEFAEMCARYAFSLGVVMGSSEAITAGKCSVGIPKKRIRGLCKDQLDEKEYIEVKTEMFNLLRSVVNKGWGQMSFGEAGFEEVSLNDIGSEYVLEFRRRDFLRREF